LPGTERTVRILAAGLKLRRSLPDHLPEAQNLGIRRQDGQPFAIQSFTARLLANTAGAGADIEVMPLLNGENGFLDPLKCPATRYDSSEFAYTTPTLTGFDAYGLFLLNNLLDPWST
jgi:hypothetical protein